MLSLRGSHRKKAVPKSLGLHLHAQPPPAIIPTPAPIVELAKAYSASLKNTLANSLKDNSHLHEKLLKVKQDLKRLDKKTNRLLTTTSGAGRPN